MPISRTLNLRLAFQMHLRRHKTSFFAFLKLNIRRIRLHRLLRRYHTNPAGQIGRFYFSGRIKIKSCLLRLHLSGLSV